MSIAEKLTTIAENVQKVYDAGKAAGGDYDQGYDDGKNSVLSLERYAKSMQIISLNVFGVAEVTLNLDNANTLINLCNINEDNNKNITVEKITINCPNQIANMQNMFYCNASSRYDYMLKHITLNVDTQNCTNINYAFSGMVALEVIDGQPLNLSGITNANYTRAFVNIPSLVDVRFVVNSILVNISFSSCAKLSAETIQSIIDGLADLTGSDTQTLTVHEDVGAKLTDEQKATITAKNWTLAY